MVKPWAFLSELWVVALYLEVFELVRIWGFIDDWVISFTLRDPAKVMVRLRCLHRLVWLCC